MHLSSWQKILILSRKAMPLLTSSRITSMNPTLVSGAVLFYRVANLILEMGDDESIAVVPDNFFLKTARIISEKAKVITGIEIQPTARIGRRFVIDHGSTTVIGEQCEIGDDCYILQNVTLGGRAVSHSSNIGGRRHPIIGNNVQIAGGVMVFGPVTIGDNCIIDSGARISEDVPDNARVRVISTHQITFGNHHSVEVYGIIPAPDGLVISGEGLANLSPVLLDHEHQIIEDFLFSYYF